MDGGGEVRTPEQLVLSLTDVMSSVRKYAIKIYQKSKLNDSMKRKAVQREIMALKKIDHPHIIKMHDLIETSK